jgi:hypothetical protein
LRTREAIGIALNFNSHLIQIWPTNQSMARSKIPKQFPKEGKNQFCEAVVVVEQRFGKFLLCLGVKLTGPVLTSVVLLPSHRR